MARSVAGNRGSRSCIADMLTASCRCGGQPARPSKPGAGIRAERSPIIPVSSATGMKTSGGTEPCSGLSQRASTSKPTRSAPRQGDDRLIGRPDLAARDRRAEIGFEPRARLQGDVHFRVEETKRSAPFALALIHRDIRGVQQGVGIVVLRRREGDADRRIHFDLPVIPGNGLSHRRNDLLHQAHEGVAILVIGNQRDEFVAAETSRHAPRRHEIAQAVGDRAQNGVARRVAMHVVDRLEPIEIDQQDGEASSSGVHRARAASSVSWNNRRLGSPVSESCRAVFSARASAAMRAAMAFRSRIDLRIVATTAPTPRQPVSITRFMRLCRMT